MNVPRPRAALTGQYYVLTWFSGRTPNISGVIYPYWRALRCLILPQREPAVPAVVKKLPIVAISSESSCDDDAPTVVTSPARDSHPAMSIDQVSFRPEPEQDGESHSADAALQAPVSAVAIWLPSTTTHASRASSRVR